MDASAEADWCLRTSSERSLAFFSARRRSSELRLRSSASSTLSFSLSVLARFSCSLDLETRPDSIRATLSTMDCCWASSLRVASSCSTARFSAPSATSLPMRAVRSSPTVFMPSYALASGS